MELGVNKLQIGNSSYCTMLQNQMSKRFADKDMTDKVSEIKTKLFMHRKYDVFLSLLMLQQSKISFVDILKVNLFFSSFGITVLALSIYISLFGGRNDIKVDELYFIEGFEKGRESYYLCHN